MPLSADAGRRVPVTSSNSSNLVELFSLPAYLQDPKSKDKNDDNKEPLQEYRCFLGRFLKAYCDEFKKKDNDNDKKDDNDDKKKDNGNGDKKDNGNDDNNKKDNGKDDDSASKRPRPAGAVPLAPFPSGEYQGYPLIGVPYETTKYPLMKALDGTQTGNFLDDNRIRIYGWLNASVNFSTNRSTNTPTSYWVAPNSLQLDQARGPHRTAARYCANRSYRLGFQGHGRLRHRLPLFHGRRLVQPAIARAQQPLWLGPDRSFTATLYFPGVFEGMIVTFGRWVATPDIETQFAPDNYMGTHSLLFTVDVYTETGIMSTIMLNEQWTVQAALHAGR